jgi:DNA (cytosine-5)-methyltransferase 1
MRIIHYDLFAGIGGFSYALDTIFKDYERKHIFCEWEQFPTAILKKHWPNATYYGDIADLVADTYSQRERDGFREVQEADGEVPERNDNAQFSNSNSQYELNTNTKCEGLEGSKQDNTTRHFRQCNRERSHQAPDITILTGGFPCQPFSHAGRRKGTADDRYKWPEMFAVIRNVKPDWIIAENVRGLASWNDGMVLETVCADLESEGYEVQPFIIPAASVGAPHKRERVWIVANTVNSGQGRTKRGGTTEQDSLQKEHRSQHSATRESERTDSNGKTSQSTSDTTKRASRPRDVSKSTQTEQSQCISNHPSDWADDWQEVALATCHDRMDDGLPRRLDGATSRGKLTNQISSSQHRKDRLKACGNAIVPQVAMEIFASIRQVIQ